MFERITSCEEAGVVNKQIILKISEVKDTVWSKFGLPPADNCELESIHECAHPRNWSEFELFSCIVFVLILAVCFLATIYCTT